MSTPTSTVTQVFDIGGNVTSSTNNGVTSTVNTTSTTNYAAPSSVSLSTSLTTNLTWSSFLGVTGVTDPNNDQATMNYDPLARPQTTTSPYGATTTNSYYDTATPPYHTATTNGHWVTNQMDGFGRTVQTITGYGTNPATTISTVYTTYMPCGCSPLGKVSKVSQPWVSGTVYNTVYTYDALGRTVSIASPDGTSTQSTTHYAYQGNQVTVTDPAGNSKTYTMRLATSRRSWSRGR